MTSQSAMAGLTSQRNSTASVSATPSTLQGSQGSRPQSEMKGRTEDELRGATYFVDLTTKEDAILYADSKVVEAVIQDLHTTFQALTFVGDSSATDPRIPESFPSESQSYEPFAHLLNKIITTADSHISQSLLRGLRFHPFGNEVKEIYGSQKRLKPDGVGIIGELPVDTKKQVEESAGRPAKKPELSWEQVEVVFESKATVRDMVRQSGTYARCCILSNQRRFFSLGIGFQYKKKEAYVFVFHHGGLSSSHPLKITTREGFNDLVKHIVGILSIEDDTAYGLDLTRSQKLFWINDRYYGSVRYLHVRGTFRGRSTIVHDLQTVDVIPDEVMITKSRELTLTPGITNLPDKLTYKLTYQIKGHSLEGPLFSEFNGQFGIADVIGHYECGPDDPHGSPSRFLNDAKFWKVFEQNGTHEPEERVLQCIAFSGEAQALLDLDNKERGTPSPGELLESILHAIIGHYTLFDKGILHRDISVGNVMRYPQPISRPALQKFECTKDVKECRGFLIDGDHAIIWRKSSRSQSISGTMPFMSMRVLAACQKREGIIHTALDDLESFLWLLIWCIVYASKDIGGATAANQGIQLMLDAWSGDAITNRTKLPTAEYSWTDAVFGGLIQEWLGILKNANYATRAAINLLPKLPLVNKEGSQWDKACNFLELEYRKTYEHVLQSGFNHLAEVQKYSTWEDVVTANSGLDEAMVF